MTNKRSYKKYKDHKPRPFNPPEELKRLAMEISKRCLVNLRKRQNDDTRKVLER